MEHYSMRLRGVTPTGKHNGLLAPLRAAHAEVGPRQASDNPVPKAELIAFRDPGFERWCKV